MDKLRVALLLASLLAGANALVNAIHVSPIKASWSGHRLAPNNYVSQLVTCNFDSLSYVELFAGDYGQGGAYNLRVVTYPDGAPVAEQDGGTYVRPCAWVRFDDISVTHAERVVKGKLLEFKFTRSGSDSINFYYDHTDPYKYGNIPDNAAPNPADLCMRACSVTRLVHAMNWTATSAA